MITRTKTSILLMLSFLIASPLFGMTLLNQDGERMQATPMIVGAALPDANNYAVNYNNWITLRDDYNINTVRLCWVDPWYEDRYQPAWNVSDAMDYVIDQAVANADAAGMSIIINYHNTGENETIRDFNENIIALPDLTRNQAVRMEFWTAVANDYGHMDHVYFELVNEPVFSYDNYTNPIFKNALLDLYDAVDDIAPDREILLFSFNNMVGPYSMLDIVENYANEGRIDWNKTTVAFHGYSNLTHITTQPVHDLIGAGYKVMCTEWDYQGNYPEWVPETIDGHAMAAKAWEDPSLSISWADWRDFNDYKTSPPSDPNYVYLHLDTLIEQAQNEGYAWWNGLAGAYRLSCQWGGKYLSGNNSEGSNAWQVVNHGPLNTGFTSMIWHIEQVSGNTYRLRCQWGSKYLSSSNAPATGQVVQNGPLNTTYSSMLWDLEWVEGNVYRLRNHWNNQYLQGNGSEPTGFTNVITNPLNTSWYAQRWVLELVP